MTIGTRLRGYGAAFFLLAVFWLPFTVFAAARAPEITGDAQELEAAVTAAPVLTANAGPAAPDSAAQPAAAPANPNLQIDNPYAAPGIFRKAQFHLHTANSFDGNKEFTPEATARAFKRAGYAFIIFTDHDYASQFTSLNDETFVAVPGYESTGPSGHIGAWFVTATVDPRLPPQVRIQAIRQAGGIAALNHPDWDIGFGGEQLKQLEGYQCLEIYNYLSTRREGRLKDNLEKWRQALNQKGRAQPVWGIAVSDTHSGFTGGGWTMVKTATVSASALREAILRGSMYATTGPEFRVLDVRDGAIIAEAAPGPADASDPDGNVRPGASLIRFIDQDGNVVQETTAGRAVYRPTGAERWVRIEASDAFGRTAWSQPFWITVRTPVQAWNDRPVGGP